MSPETPAAPARRLKVVHVIRNLRKKGGGAQTSVFQLMSRLDRTRFEPVIVCLEQNEPPPQHFLDAGIRVIGLMMPHRWSPLGILRLVRLFRAENADIVHTHLRRAGVTGRIAAWMAGVPVILAHVRNIAVRSSWGSRFVDRSLARITDRVIGVSPAVIEQKHEFGLPPERLAVIVNGVDRELFKPASRADCRAPFSLPAGDFVIGFSGRLEPAKHVDTMIRAAALAAKEVPEIRVAIAGEGHERPVLEKLAAELDFAGRVSFLGHCSGMQRVYPMFDALCLPSEAEGCSRALLEAAACGVPLVATPIAFAPEMTGRNEEAGLLVPLGDVQGFARAFVRLAREAGLAARLGSAIRERSSAWSIEEHVRQVTELYLDLWKTKGAGRP